MATYKLVIKTDDSDGGYSDDEMVTELDKLEEAIGKLDVWEFVEYPTKVE